MTFQAISADCHMDLTFLPPDTFISRVPAKFRDRAPRVVDRDGVTYWMSGPRYAVLRRWASPIAWGRVAVTDAPDAGLPESFPNWNRFAGCFDHLCQCMTCSTRSHRGRASATR